MYQSHSPPHAAVSMTTDHKHLMSKIDSVMVFHDHTQQQHVCTTVGEPNLNSCRIALRVVRRVKHIPGNSGANNSATPKRRVNVAGSHTFRGFRCKIQTLQTVGEGV